MSMSPRIPAKLAGLALMALLLCDASTGAAATIFSDNFEGTLAKWPTQTNIWQTTGGNPNKCVYLLWGAATLASQSISVSSGTTYYLSVDYNQPGRGGYVKVDEYNGGGQLKATQWIFSDNSGTQSALQYFSGSSGWHTYTQTFTTGAPTQSIIITLMSNTSFLNWPAFDNVNLATTPAGVTVTTVKWEEVVK
jgi:hypothetical protein